MGTGKEKVVITGIGAVTPNGNNVTEYWDSLLKGKSGIRQVTLIDTTGYPAHIAGEVRDIDLSGHMRTREEKFSDRFTKFALIAAQEALDQSGLIIDDGNRERVGVIIGSGIGGLTTIENNVERALKRGPRKTSAYAIPMGISDMASGLASMRFGARGPNYSVSSACATGAHALGTCMRLIQHGDADVMITGGAEAPVNRLGLSCFGNMKALSSRESIPEEASCPFDRRRDGFVIAEGAGILILESESHAKARGAEILVELAGYGATADAYHITAPDPSARGAIRCMEIALKDAGVDPVEIDYINAHGTSTQLNDAMETRAIKEVLGPDVAKKVKISSTKSMIGHLLGAAAAVEAVATLKIMETGIIHPTINYREKDPECDLDYTPNKPVEKQVDIAISNSFGFGGHNASLVFRKYR